MGCVRPGALPCLGAARGPEGLALRPAIPLVHRSSTTLLPRGTWPAAPSEYPPYRCATRHQKPHSDKAATPQPAFQPNAVPPPSTSLRAHPSPPPPESLPSCLWAFVGASGRCFTLGSPALPPARPLPGAASRPAERRDQESLLLIVRNHRRSLTDLPDFGAICEFRACSVAFAHAPRPRPRPRPALASPPSLLLPPFRGPNPSLVAPSVHLGNSPSR